MRVHKKVIFYSMLIIISTFTISFLLEFRIIILCHSNFITNLLIGIFASSVLSLVISIASYLNEKRKVVKDLFSTTTEVGNASDYFIRWLSQYYLNSAITIPTDKKLELVDNLKTLCSVVNEAFLVDGYYSPILSYNGFNKLLKKYQANESQFNYCEFVYNRNISEVYIKARMTYEYYLRANLQTNDTITFTKKFEKELSDLITLIDAKSNLQKTIEQFTPVLLKKLGIKEKPKELMN